MARYAKVIEKTDEGFYQRQRQRLRLIDSVEPMSHVSTSTEETRTKPHTQRSVERGQNEIATRMKIKNFASQVRGGEPSGLPARWDDLCSYATLGSMT